MNSIIKSIKYVSRKANASKIGAYSAQTAFFMFLSFIPLMVLVLSLLNQIHSSIEVLTLVTESFTPNVITSFFEAYADEIASESNKTLTIASTVVLLWSASKGIFAIIGGLNSVYECKETRNYFVLRVVAMFYTIMFVAVLIGTISLLLFGNRVYFLFSRLFPEIKDYLYFATTFRYFFGFFILVLFFSLVYKKLPNDKRAFKSQIPGACIASAGWICFSVIFSIFVDNFNSFSNVYGSLTTITAMMLWLYICMLIFFFGAETNVILENKTIGSVL